MIRYTFKATFKICKREQVVFDHFAADEQYIFGQAEERTFCRDCLLDRRMLSHLDDERILKRVEAEVWLDTLKAFKELKSYYGEDALVMLTDFKRTEKEENDL